MIGIVIVAHGGLAREYLAAVEHVVGHQQVTDSYLVALAVAHGGRLATFDRGLAEALPEGAFLIPDPGADHLA